MWILLSSIGSALHVMRASRSASRLNDFPDPPRARGHGYVGNAAWGQRICDRRHDRWRNTYRSGLGAPLHAERIALGGHVTRAEVKIREIVGAWKRVIQI